MLVLPDTVRLIDTLSGISPLKELRAAVLRVDVHRLDGPVAADGGSNGRVARSTGGADCRGGQQEYCGRREAEHSEAGQPPSLENGGGHSPCFLVFSADGSDDERLTFGSFASTAASAIAKMRLRPVNTSLIQLARRRG